MFDPFIIDGGTTGTNTIRLERMLDSFITSTAKLREEARASGAMNRERCLESQRIASRIAPRRPAARVSVNRPSFVRRQPPARFAFYQGNF